MSLAPLIAERRIIVCVGSGGVGKTTAAAALALAGARRGRRTLVLTIDPARRLANALGLEQLDHEERRISDESVDAQGGALYAMMLDQKRAFDEMVERRADAELVRRITNNRIYRQLSTRLAGSHEYAALAKLYEICCMRAPADRYDLIVLDTPPTANALDFLDAPHKVMSAIDSPALDWFARPAERDRAFSYRAIGFWGASILKRLAKFVGARFLEDMAVFIREFQAVIGEFRQRASHVLDLLRRPDVAFVIVCTPHQVSIDEALYFRDRLEEARMPLGSFVINRVHPRGPAGPAEDELERALIAEGRLHGFPSDDLHRAAADLTRTYREFQTMAAIDGQRIDRLRQATSLPCVEVPLFDHDICDVAGLAQMAAMLVG